MSKDRKMILKERIAEALEVAEDRYFGSGGYVGSIIDLTLLRIHLMGYAIEYGAERVKKNLWRSNYPYHRQDMLERLIEKRVGIYRERLASCTKSA